MTKAWMSTKPTGGCQNSVALKHKKRVMTHSGASERNPAPTALRAEGSNVLAHAVDKHGDKLGPGSQAELQESASLSLWLSFLSCWPHSQALSLHVVASSCTHFPFSQVQDKTQFHWQSL